MHYIHPRYIYNSHRIISMMFPDYWEKPARTILLLGRGVSTSQNYIIRYIHRVVRPCTITYLLVCVVVGYSATAIQLCVLFIISMGNVPPTIDSFRDTEFPAMIRPLITRWVYEEAWETSSGIING